MLKGRGRDPRVNASKVPAHLAGRSPAQAQGVRQPAHNPTHLTIRTPSLPRAPLAKPEPDYEVVEFPSEQYVNAKLQPPPPPPPRPPTGHPAEAASCGLCGGGGARVRCTECGRRALCASCDDMYHRHPKRRHHQRQALSLNQIRDDPRPPLPPKGTPPVPPPRRHKISGDRMSASPRPPSADSRNMTLASHPVVHTQTMPLNNRMASQTAQQIPAHLQRLSPAAAGGHLGSMPYLPAAHHAAPAPPGTLGHLAPGWQRPRTSLPGFNMPPNVPMAPEAWESPDNMVTQSWGRPLRRGASVLELGGGMGVGMGSAGGVCGAGGACAGGQCGWRYGSCASLDHQAWPAPAWPAPCCHPPVHPHAHMHAPYTPQPYRRADSRAASRVASRAGSRAASPAMSVRSRASRRTKHRTPSPPPLPSSDADSESDSEPERPPPKEQLPSHPPASMNKPITNPEERAGPAAARAPWQCEHCTFVNEPGVRVCAVCCRTPTAAPRELPAHDTPYDNTERTESPSVLDSARSVAKSARGLERLDLRSPERLDLRSPERLDLRSPERLDLRSPKRLDLRSPDPPPPAAAPAPAAQQRTQQNGETSRAATKKERISTGCGPSPPREDNVRKYNNRLVTPTREQSVDSTRTRHDMAVGASPPREVQSRASVAHSPPRQSIMRASPFREPAKQHETPTRHSISVGPSPPRENSVRSSPVPIQKKSAGTSPPRDRDNESRASSTLVRTTVSNTGTSPPPQSISTQTYEVPNAWERAPSAARTRSRRRLRDDARRERSHSRHSLSSDTRESERTSGGGGGGSSGRWEWRSGRSARDSSPGAEWSGSERRPPPRLARRASHLDLRRDARAPPRRASFYRDEAASPEPTRAMSLETLATATGANAAAASRGLELARLMADAERLGFSAAEVQAALAQSPAAPLAWLRERWPSLCAGVRAAAARLAPRARVTELEARAALARHRGAMWPAVTDCVERHRRQAEKESGTRQHGGRVWGSPAGADDDAAPPRGLRAEDSSDEFDGPPPTDFRDDDWMYLPLDVCAKGRRESISMDEWDVPPADFGYREVASDVALELSRLLVQAGVLATTDNLMLNNLLSNAEPLAAGEARNVGNKQNSIDLIQSENDFIDAYNALTRSTPLPTVDNRPETVQTLTEKDAKRDMYDVNENHSHLNIENTSNKAINNIPVMHIPETLTVPSVQSSVIQNKQSQDISNIINGHVQHGDGETSTVLINKQNSNPSTEVSNSPIQFTNTPMDDRGDNRQINENIEQTFIDNFGESLPSISAIASNVKDSVNVKGDNNPRPDQNVNQGLEKSSSNLNDIVGNTQRLIQQMKDEINSDINYIDSKNKSQSEADSSSNESDISSEHESSYSDTEDKETDDLSSDESETLSTDNEAEHLHERRPTIIHRTSSEENDQFEEAMDHIEDQMEDFKNTNIEILDSIARSLQEEHTISVEVSEPIITNDKRQDLNNNLFVEVNSFEEIYAELNTNKKETPNQKIISKIQNDNPNANSSQKAEINIAAQDKTVSNPNATTLIERIILEDKPNLPNESTEKNFEKPIHTDHIPDKVEEVTNNLPYEENNESAVDSSSNSSDEESDSLNSADSDITPTDQNILTNTDVKSITENMNNLQLSTENTFIQNTEADNLVEQNVSREIMEEIIAIENTHQHIEIEEDSSEEFKTVEDDIEQTTIVENISDENISPNIAEQHFNIEDGIEQNITIENDNKLNIGVTETTETPIIARKNNIAETIAIVENGYEQSNPITEQKSTTTENIATENNQEENIVTVNHNDQQNNDNVVINTINETTDITNQEIKVEIKKEVAVSEERRKSLSKSPPKSPTDAAGTNKTFIANKSNIPKLVKVLPNNKQKADKTSSKVVASKVPVRRASLKQYPAPTPPKTHFGNVQSGHVKQLQTRLFNNKFPKTVVNVPDVVDVKPSTSTIHKKKPAPPPPTTNQKQPPLTKTSPPKEKKNSFFRESCRTEDEWTESDAEDTPLPPPRENQEPNRAPSPPPPVTVRRVSGQIIDLARVRLPEGSPERQARMLLAEGATETWEQARLAVELVSRGAEPPAALLAALECADLSAALAYLHQDCELCAERLPEHEMVSMLRCTHRCCRECARLYFTVQITERSIADCVCPYCKEPDLENTPEDAWFEYFAHLDILLKTLLETDVHELFQRKLRDRTLARDPNFRWCMECSSGFFVHPKQKKIRCPECRSVSCAKCRKAWSVNHEGLSCEQYAAWLDDNDPERSIAAVQQHLRENGLECPRCRFKYSLSRGGCMHFTCTQCKYEFCYGCGKPFMMGARCGLSEYCAKLGLHAHHPRNCLFYLRDKEPHELQTLLQMNNVAYETEAPEGSTNRCPIQLQRETPTGLVDGICGNETPPTYAGLCKPHYVEYLAARARALDPIPIMDVSELVAELRRRALPLPERGPWDTDPIYAGMCAEIVKEKIPLD